MPIANILLPVGAAGARGTTADVAFAIAASFGARVEAAHPCLPVVDRIRYMDEASGTYVQKLIEQARAQVVKEQEQARRAFDAIVKAHPGVKTVYGSYESDAAWLVAKRGRVSDLTVVPPVDGDEAALWSEIRDAALFHTGRAIVCAPRKPLAAGVGETVVVAWKDSLEAARALTAARPFIAKAKKVRVVSIGSEDYLERSLRDAATYLELAGARVESAMLAAGRRGIGETLADEALKSPGALLVMGAYSQWRVKEWVLGGVTEYILREAPVPALMAH